MAEMDQKRLPSNFKPLHYDLELFEIGFEAPFSYHGRVRIDLAVNRPTDTVWLNSKELIITDATASSGNASLKAPQVSYNGQLQRVELRFPGTVSGPTASLTIQFTGTINNTLSGFYRSSTDTSLVVSTTFEACHARRAFPCFDEPNLKATFALSIRIPRSLTALSNMPMKEVVEKDDGTKIVSFETTPLMSTYLLAWAVGEFEHIAATTNKEHNGNRLPVRVYTTKGLISQAQYALQHACRVMDYFSEIFQIDYPLPKLDLIAIPEYAHGAMENWGLCTFQSTALLIDQATSSLENRERVSYVVAHELAHQWFGNLVTMDWWNDLWLNEGFATWAGWLAADHFHPTWNLWRRFIADGLQTAFQLDSLRASHPIDVDVKDGPDIDEIFDDISYLKGSSLIRMLVNYLGQESFFNGMGSYLRTFAFKNARSVDLWNHLSQASGKDVQSFMEGWIRQMGFPVVSIELDNDHITLFQERLLLSNDMTSEERHATWRIPLYLPQPDEKSLQEMHIKSIRVKKPPSSGDWTYLAKLNPNQTGFFRVSFSSDIMSTLVKDQHALSVEEKVLLVADLTALVVAGKHSVADLMTALDSFQQDTDYFVWFQISKTLDLLSSVFSGITRLRQGLSEFKRKLAKNVAIAESWDALPEEAHIATKQRALNIRIAGMANDERVLSRTSRMLEQSKFNAASLHSSLVPVILTITAAHGGIEGYNAVKDIYLNGPSTSIDLKETCLRAMASTSSQNALDDYLSLLLSPSVQVADLPIAASALVTDAFSRTAFWSWLKNCWDQVLQKFDGGLFTLDRFLTVGLSGYSESDTMQEIKQFFDGMDREKIGFSRGWNVVQERISVNVKFRSRTEKDLEYWLVANGYLG